ncbi:sensor histidine kinase [Nakamurella endophytica]|uniref:sensor histidine kinase n=1 Tax=Nakamurella endophytica TaxID=1748367 RepID=UPI0035715962
MIIAVCAVVGVVTEVFLSKYLVQQVDTRLNSTVQRRGPGDDGAPPRTSPSATALPAPECTTQAGPYGRQPDDSIFAVVQDGEVTGAVLRRSFGTCSVLTAAQAAPLVGIRIGSPPQTVDLGDFGSFRVVARAAGDETLVSALSLSEVSDTQVRLAVIMAAVMGGALLAGGGAVFWIVRRSVRPLERVAATARQVSTLQLARGEVDLSVRVPERDTDRRTEIGQVGAALNQMLGHVSSALESRHASETRVRQFVADASHELRTPLAAIRGYAELARRGEHDPGAVAHALRRVESESARMTTLVEDLLLLARLDSGRPLAGEEVDLTMLVVDRVSDARVAGPDHRWQLDLPDEPVTVVGDGARLHQVLANLLANARTHTPPGTTVVTGLRAVPDGVLLTVTDDGPGIPAELQPEIFNRFVRGDSSRSRAAGSTGLGLAIVAAVIAAHGGAVSVESRPGRTQARVWLPDIASGATEAATVPAAARQDAGRAG